MKKHGFSLVELSIVLVILGLLVGGILAGQSLIRASELRSVGTEYDRHNTALHAFRDKYFALPGDMVNAVRIWGNQMGTLADGPTAGCGTTTIPATDQATCNGDGDGIIGFDPVLNEAYESYRYWQHLANAGLVEGQYIGIRDPVAGIATAGKSIPASKYPGGAWGMNWLNTQLYPSGSKFDLMYGNAFVFGAPNGTVPVPQGPLLTTEGAWNIDVKYDDGLPGQGKFITYKNNGSLGHNCDTTTDPVTAVYRLNTPGNLCSFLIRTGFQ